VERATPVVQARPEGKATGADHTRTGVQGEALLGLPSRRPRRGDESAHGGRLPVPRKAVVEGEELSSVYVFVVQ
jgi:hypothetical protein